jgi:uncharacterized protein YaiI (UPF0178 family)
MTGPKIYVDGDACPVKDEVLSIARRHGLAVFMVSNTWLRMAEGPGVERIVVGEGADAADDWIAEHIGAGDIAVTSDIQLAARCLGRDALALDPVGKAFTEDSIGTQLAMRDLMAHLRDTGEVRGGGRGRNRRDRERFIEAMERTVTSILRRQQ